MKLWRGLMLLVVLLAPAGAAWAEACNKTIRWYDDPPYAFRGKDGTLQGLDVDLARTALQRMDCSATFVEMPWARALIELEAGRLDILPGALRRPERERFAYFSRPTNRSPNVLFIGKLAAQRYQIRELADVMGTRFRLGAQIGVAYGPAYDSLLKEPDFASRLSLITSRRGAWKMIGLNRLDGLIADEASGLVELKELGLTHAVAKTRLVVSGDASMFALSKRAVSPEFVARFDHALDAMIGDGQYRRIRQRYIPCPVSADQIGCR